MSLSDAECFAEVERLVTSGFDVKFAARPKDDCYQVTLLSVGLEDDLNGYALTGRAADPMTAFYVLLYKHHTMLEGSWDNEVQRDFDADDLM